MIPQPSSWKPSIKIYSDGADRATLLQMNDDPKISGMTTNPSLMKKAGVQDFEGFCREILTAIKTKPISFEVFADDLPTMKKQAHAIAKWGKNVYVKIPVINTEGVSTAPLVRELSHAGIQLNVTAIFSSNQVDEVCAALKGGAPSIVSVFAGRLADSGMDPIPFVTAAAAQCRSMGPHMELLWASTREIFNFYQAEMCGCHIITSPPDLIKKLDGLGKTPQNLSLETVRMFKKDSDAAGFKLNV